MPKTGIRAIGPTVVGVGPVGVRVLDPYLCQKSKNELLLFGKLLSLFSEDLQF